MNKALTCKFLKDRIARSEAKRQIRSQLPTPIAQLDILARAIRIPYFSQKRRVTKRLTLSMELNDLVHSADKQVCLLKKEGQASSKEFFGE